MLSLPRKSLVAQHSGHPNRDPAEPKMSLGGVRAWSWLRYPGMHLRLRILEGSILCKVCVSMPFMTVVAWLSLGAVRRATKAEPSGSGVSAGGIPGRQSSSMCGMLA